MPRGRFCLPGKLWRGRRLSRCSVRYQLFGNPECEADFTHQLDSERRRALARDRQRRRRDRLRSANER